MIHDILEEKITSAGLAQVGQDLFREHMPSAVSRAVMTRMSPDGIPVDLNMPGFHKTSLQIIVRHPDPDDGMKLATDVMNAVSIAGGNETHAATSERPKVRLVMIVPEHLPIKLPRLKGDDLEFSINFRVVFSVKATWL